MWRGGASERVKAKEKREEAESVGKSERANVRSDRGENAKKRGVWRGGASERDRGEDARKRGVWREGASEREAQGNGECGGEEGVSRTGTN